MKSSQEIVAKAIECVIGKPLEAGKIVAHQSNERSMTFLRYEGDQAICSDAVMGEVTYPKDELFDVNLMQKVALEIQDQELRKMVEDAKGDDHGTFIVNV